MNSLMLGKTLDNRYELVEFIGKGGMALVYRAIDHRTGHSVAVKILRPEFNQDEEFLERFEREATTASRMSHHNIVNLLDVGQDGEFRYLVMEYVRGRTLKDVIQQKGALPPAVAAQIGIRILSALQHAHKNGIIHRDIKPQNILVHSDGLIKVADFGIARVAGSNTISHSDSVMGSVYYFSPEQAQGKDVTFASDLYSVGVVLYEMMTGQPPFDGETPVAIALQHISGKARPMSEINPAVPPAMERVVAKAMEKRPEDRYQSALEMAQDLQRALQEPDGTWLGRLPDKKQAVAQATGRHQALRARRKKLLMAVTGIVALLMLIVFGFTGSYVYDQIVNTTTAPYVLDEQEPSALRLISRAGLRYEIIRVADENHSAGTVILQKPEYGTSMRKGEIVYLTISTGAEEKAIPRVTDVSLDEAWRELERYGFTLLALPERKLSNAPWNTVLSQSPAAGEMAPSGSVVQVTLSGGSVTLPELSDMLRSDALRLLAELDLELAEIKEIPVQDASKVERVATQRYFDDDMNQYNVGDRVMQKTKVTLAVYVSAEPATLQPPHTSAPEGDASQ